MTPNLLALYETYHAWLACYASRPTLTQLARACGEARGRVYARLWRLKEMGLI